MKNIYPPLGKSLKNVALLLKPAAIVLSIFGLIFIGFMLGNKQILTSSGDTVSAEQLKRMIKNKDKQHFTLINVHTPYEGEIEKTNAVIAFDKIVEQSSTLPKEKNAPIILYCKTGRMSEEAMVTLRDLGYTNVKHLLGGFDAWQKSGGKLLNLMSLEELVLPKEGITIPVTWGMLGKQLVDAGVIDLTAFRKAVTMTPEQEKILTEGSRENIMINATNSRFVVDMLWALGLAQKSIVYTDGPLGKEYLNEQGNFASTGGWTLARGDATEYLNTLDLIPLTPEQHVKVGEIAKNVYRPCCGNSTWFPDCNHGMAALAIIELLVSANIPEADIYRYVLGFNSFWFPDSYLATATYFARQGISWDNINVKEVLSEKYSSSKGAAELSKKVGQLPYRPSSGGSCGT
ncbi:rhodanese-like domain-containing protein [Patescibacteria group bacterium]|nr:rhodanese-like domain-containing protein [Patescibacteria group bacterium]